MYHEKRAIQTAFEKYLLLPHWGWTWFVTQTFDTSKCGYELRSQREFGAPQRCLHSDIVQESWKHFLHVVGSHALCTWGWMFQERHVNGRPHWHAICHVEENLFGDPQRSEIWEQMFVKYGRNEVRPFDPSACTSLSSYLTKYVVKESHLGDSTFDFGGYLGGSPADSGKIMDAIGLKPMCMDDGI